MCHAMDAFQMRSNFFLIWQLIALCTPWKTLTPLAPNDISFVIIYVLETLPCFFKASMITLVRLFAQPPSMNYSNEINIGKWH
jgi:hypothetical protein